MPFTEYNTSPRTLLICDPDQVPLFIFPGILGNDNELQALATELDKQSNKRRPIYTYRDSQFSTPSPVPLNIHEQATLIVQEMAKYLTPSPIPYLIAGFSFGCILASEVGKRLKQDYGHDVHLFLIDGIPLDSAKKHFNSDKVTTDLLSIVNYASKLARIEQGVELSESDINALSHLQVEEQVNRIYHKLSENNLHNDESLAIASKYLQVAKSNIQAIMSAEDCQTAADERVASINLFLTKETEAKHGEQPIVNAWSLQSANINIYDNADLQNTAHTNLLSKLSAAEIAREINQTIKQYITKSSLIALFEKTMHAMFNKTPKMPNANLDDTANNTLTVPPNTPTSNASSDSESNSLTSQDNSDSEDEVDLVEGRKHTSFFKSWFPTFNAHRKQKKQTTAYPSDKNNTMLVNG